MYTIKKNMCLALVHMLHLGCAKKHTVPTIDKI